MYKVFRGLAPSFMSDIFGINGNANIENVSARSRSHCYNPSNPKTVNNGLETLRSIGPKIWDMIPNEMKNTQSLRSGFLTNVHAGFVTPSFHNCDFCDSFNLHLFIFN